VLGGSGNTAVCDCSIVLGSGIMSNRTNTTFVNNLTITISTLPTSSAGLPSGSVWRCTVDDILRIVP
jgi:hypothetical protein